MAGFVVGWLILVTGFLLMMGLMVRSVNRERRESGIDRPRPTLTPAAKVITVTSRFIHHHWHVIEEIDGFQFDRGKMEVTAGVNGRKCDCDCQPCETGHCEQCVLGDK
jgi:hypothetical protein